MRLRTGAQREEEKQGAGRKGAPAACEALQELLAARSHRDREHGLPPRRAPNCWLQPASPPAAEAAVRVKGARGGLKRRRQVLPVHEVGAHGMAPHLRSAVQHSGEAIGVGARCSDMGVRPRYEPRPTLMGRQHAAQQHVTAAIMGQALKQWNQKLTMPNAHSHAFGRCW